MLRRRAVGLRTNRQMESINPPYYFAPNFTAWSMNRAIALETEFVELFSKRYMILVSLNLWRHEEFAEYALWQTGRILSYAAKFINRLRNAKLYKTYQHLCKYATQRISWIGRQPTLEKPVRFRPNASLSDILVQSSIDRWLQGYHLRRTLQLVPDPDMLHWIVHLWPSLSRS